MSLLLSEKQALFAKLSLFDLFGMAWGNRHDRPKMWPKCLMKFELLPTQLLFLSWQ